LYTMHRPIRAIIIHTWN